MPTEIQVAPPGITISQGRTFMVTDQRGEIKADSDTGIYAIDTRFISFYHLYINRQPWKLVNAFQMLQTILGLRADAPHKWLYVNPTLPEWLPELQIQQLRVGPCLFTLHFWREGEGSRWEVNSMTLDQGVAQEDSIQVLDDPDSIHKS